MTLAAKTNDSRGFTLLEVVIVLAIVGVIMGGAIGMIVYSSDERVMRDASGEIEQFAKRARTTAILKQTPYALEFREDAVRLLPLAEAGKAVKQLKRRDEDKNDAKFRVLKLKSGMAISLRRWNSEKWLKTEKDTVHIWRFDPDGLCEPLSVRLALNNSWGVDTYHPLTATIRDSELELR